PNSNLLAQNITILGKRRGMPLQHRMWIYFNVDFRFAPSRVIDVVRTALTMAHIEGVADQPPPSVISYDFAKDNRDSFAYYAVRYWLTDLANDDPTSSRIRTRIYTALERANIPLAKPAQTVFFSPEQDEADRGKRHRERRARSLGSRSFAGSRPKSALRCSIISSSSRTPRARRSRSKAPWPTGSTSFVQ